MIFTIVGGLLSAVIAAFLLALLLQLASKIACKQAVDYGDAWKTAFFGIVGSRIIEMGWSATSMETTWFLELPVQFVLWTVLISAVIGIDIAHSLAIAALMLALTWLALFVVVMLPMSLAS